MHLPVSEFKENTTLNARRPRKTNRFRQHISQISLRCLVTIGFLLARLMGQYSFPCWRLSFVVVCCLSGSATLPAGGRVGRRARVQSAPRPPGASAAVRPTLHGGPVRLRPVRATPCF